MTHTGIDGERKSVIMSLLRERYRDTKTRRKHIEIDATLAAGLFIAIIKRVRRFASGH